MSRIHTYSATFALVSIAAFGPPAEGACGGNPLLDFRGEYLVSNPDWGGSAGGDGSCGYFGCYDSQSAPPVSSEVTGVFWALGSGNPAVGAGDDNGDFTGGLGPGDAWIKQESKIFGSLYHYPAFVSLKIGSPYGGVSGGILSWNSGSTIDGCFLNNPDPSPCTCLLIADQWNGVGSYALVAARPDSNLNLDMTTGDVVRLAPVPRPVIVAASHLGGNLIAIAVTHEPVGAGQYQKDGCDCLGGFRVYGKFISSADPPPPDREDGWSPMPGPGGGTQPVTPLGGTAMVQVDCSVVEGTADILVFALGLVSEDGYETRFLSENSSIVDCGGILADPGRPYRGPHERKEDPRPERGRDGDRRKR